MSVRAESGVDAGPTPEPGDPRPDGAGARTRREFPGARAPSVTILYHYMHPDDVAGARHFDDFGRELARHGWDVEAMPCNRGCRDEARRRPRVAAWEGVRFNRVWRPNLRQASPAGRVINAIWMIVAWSLISLRRRSSLPDVVVVGTDPVCGILAARVIRSIRRGVRIVHWCFDLYPEAAVAAGVLRPDSLSNRGIRRLLGGAYGSCDLIADLGPCMRSRLDAYRMTARRVTLTPWALEEPEQRVVPDPAIRADLFRGASLGLLYSGNVGRAHACDAFLALARRLRTQDAFVCFSVRGNCAEEWRQAVREDDTNVGFAAFASEADLVRHLGAADIHLVSLRAEWTGVVVPSKFFGCLAVGRPVIFAGPRDSSIAGWIAEHGVGWVLDADSLDSVVADIVRLARDPARLRSLQDHCHQIYRRHFRRDRVMDAWRAELTRLLRPAAPDPAAQAPADH